MTSKLSNSSEAGGSERKHFEATEGERKEEVAAGFKQLQWKRPRHVVVLFPQASHQRPHTQHQHQTKSKRSQHVKKKSKNFCSISFNQVIKASKDQTVTMFGKQLFVFQDVA